jgi:RimJ/RimL family protein N-acetyltransferase
MIVSGERTICDAGRRRLREITRADEELLYRWRMDDRSRAMFRSTEKVAYTNHRRMIQGYFDPGNSDRWFVLEAESIPVGAIALYDMSDDGTTCEWGRILVDPDRRGRGYGTDLVRLMVLYCRAIGLVRVRAEVLEQNPASIYLHEAVGFATRDIVSADDGRRFVIMELDLSETP